MNQTISVTTTAKDNTTLLTKVLSDEHENKPILDFESYCNTLLDIIKDSEPEFSIGIYDEWGTGKTTLMRLVYSKLSSDKNILPIWFNPWRYEREKEFALIALMKTLAFRMGEHDIYKGLKPLLLRGIKIVGKDVLRRFASKYLLTDKGIQEFETKIRPKTDLLSEIIDKDTIYYDGFRNIEEAMKNIKNQYPASKVIVFVDDLDRCAPRTVLEVFESMKIFLNMDGFIYIVGLSYQTITRFISAEYANILSRNGKELNDEDEYIRKMGEQYIKKIIQIPVDLPPWSDSDMYGLVTDLSKRLFKPYSNIIYRNAELISNIVERNPRELKRYINSFIISYKLFSTIISPNNDNKELTEEQEKQLLIVLMLRMRWNSFYVIYSSYGLFRQEVRRYMKENEAQRAELLKKSDLPKEFTRTLQDVLYDRELWKFLNLTESVIQKIDWSLFRRAVRSGTDREIGKNLSEHSTRDLGSLLREAEDLYNTEGYNEGLSILDQALRINPASTDAWNRRGLMLDKLGRYEEALKSYDKALEIDPKYFYAWYNKGLAFDALGRYDEALEHYDKALEIDPKYAYAWNGKGYAFEALKNYEEAFKSYDKATELDPYNVYAWIGKGAVLDVQKRYREAIKCYDQVIKLNPNHAKAWNSRGADLFSLNQYEEALKSYDKALEIDPKFADAWYNKGLVNEKLQNRDESIRSYEMARRLSSRSDY
jgi:tetratricopeptide (TPR) repeat protein